MNYSDSALSVPGSTKKVPRKELEWLLVGDDRKHSGVIFQNIWYYASQNRKNVAMSDFYRIQFQSLVFSLVILPKQVKYRSGFREENNDRVLRWQ